MTKITEGTAIPAATTAAAALKYADAVNFARLRVEENDGEVLWPCVVFENKNELRKALPDLVRSIGHGSQISRALVKELQDEYADDADDDDEEGLPEDVPSNGDPVIDDGDGLQQAPVRDSNTNYAAYLLGEKIPSTHRLVFVPSPLPAFQSQYNDAQLKSRAFPGFKDALYEALKLSLGPEFSKTRLRFSVILDDDNQRNISWPCILFDDYHRFLDGLKTRGLLSTDKAELSFAREYIEVVEGGHLPPYVYYFGKKPNGKLVGGFEYQTAVGDALIEHYENNDFWNALHQALRAVKTDTTVTQKTVATSDLVHQAPEKQKHKRSSTMTLALPLKRIMVPGSRNNSDPPRNNSISAGAGAAANNTKPISSAGREEDESGKAASISSIASIKNINYRSPAPKTMEEILIRKRKWQEEQLQKLQAEEILTLKKRSMKLKYSDIPPKPNLKHYPQPINNNNKKAATILQSFLRK